MISNTVFAPTHSAIRPPSPAVSDSTSILTASSAPYIPPWERMALAAGSQQARRPPSSIRSSSSRADRGSATPPLSFRGRPPSLASSHPTGPLHPSRRLYGDSSPSELTQYVTPDVGIPLDAIPLCEIATYHAPEFAHARAAGSYKWVAVESGRPTIAVPGVPDRWVREREGQVGRVRHDSELLGNVEYKDYGASQVPPGMSPFEPIFHSLSSPGVLEGLDVIAPRTTLLTLFSYFLTMTPTPGPAFGSRAGPRFKLAPRWRINASLLPGTQTVLLHRWSPDPHTARDTPRSWHLAYHEAMTEAELEGSHRTPGCHQLVQYEFCGLRMLVRFNADAYDPALADEGVTGWTDERMEDGLTQADRTSASSRISDHGSETTSISTSIISEHTADHVLVSRFSSILEGLDFEPVTPRVIKALSPTDRYLPPAARAAQNQAGLGIIPSYLRPVPLSTLINLKTRQHTLDSPRSDRRNEVKDFKFAADMYAQTLFAQTPHLYIARHTEGDFRSTPLCKLRMDGSEMRELAADYEGAVGRVRGMLDEIVRLTRAWGNVAFIGDAENGVEVLRWKGVESLSEEAMTVVRVGTATSRLEKALDSISIKTGREYQ